MITAFFPRKKKEITGDSDKTVRTRICPEQGASGQFHSCHKQAVHLLFR